MPPYPPASRSIRPADRPTDALGLAQGCIAHRLVERLAQLCGEIADRPECRRDIDEAVALRSDMRAGARSGLIAGLAGQPGTNRIEGDMAQCADQMCLIHRDRAEAPCDKCPVTRMRSLM